MQDIEKELKEILSFGRELGYPLILEDSAKFLFETVKNKNPKNILEIGTAIGYSGSMMLSCCEGSLVTLEKNPESAEIAKSNFEKLGLSNRVQVINVDAGEYLKECEGKYDFIFLDGPKAQYVRYKEKLIQMLNVGGILFADNVLFRGLVRKEGFPDRKYRSIVVNLRQFISEIENDDRLDTKVYDIGDGVSISIKK